MSAKYFADQLIGYLVYHNAQLGINIPELRTLYDLNIGTDVLITLNIAVILKLSGLDLPNDRYMYDSDFVELFGRSNTHWIFKGRNYTDEMREPRGFFNFISDDDEDDDILDAIEDFTTHIERADYTAFKRLKVRGSTRYMGINHPVVLRNGIVDKWTILGLVEYFEINPAVKEITEDSDFVEELVDEAGVKLVRLNRKVYTKHRGH